MSDRPPHEDDARVDDRAGGAPPEDAPAGRAPTAGTPRRPPTPDDRGPRARRRPSGGRGLLTLVLALALAGAAWTAWRLAPPDPSATGTVVFDLEPGWGAARAARELEEAGLVRDATVFSLYLRVRGLDRGVGEGLYDLSPALPATEVARRLAEGGRPRTAMLVIPEGFRASDVARRLEEAGVEPAEDVLARVGEPGELAPPWLPEDAGLEGYLFPDSYELRLDATADEALGVMVAHFESHVPELRAGLEEAGLDLDLHGLTTLASMVQAEAAGPEEMNVIAGVFLNRLDRGMLLQSDPTAVYGLGKDLPELSVAAGDLAADHPWNTYRHPGLPIGPIGNPGLDALRAVLAPDRHAPDGEPWLYFLHGTDDGEPVFRPNTSLAAHERDIDRFLR